MTQPNKKKRDNLIMAALDASNNRPKRYQVGNAPVAELDAYIEGVERAAHCLAHYLDINFSECV